MSKVLWHTITIKVPSEMVELTKTGKISIKKTLTKTLNISRSQKKPSIRLIASNVSKPEIVNNGEEWNIEKLRTSMNKSNELAQKNKGRDIFKTNTHSKIKLFKSNIKSHAKHIIDKRNEAKKKEHASSEIPEVEKKSNLLKMFDIFEEIKEQLTVFKASTKTKKPTEQEQEKITILINKAKALTNNNVYHRKIFNLKLKETMRGYKLLV